MRDAGPVWGEMGRYWVLGRKGSVLGPGPGLTGGEGVLMGGWYQCVGGVRCGSVQGGRA